MKRIILLTIILIFLTGCSGLYNLNNFVLPDDLEFLALIKELDTPKKISDYMLENFTCKYNPFYAPSPYELWKIKEGDCNDFATFGVFMAFHNDIEVAYIHIFFKGTFDKHMIAVYVEDDGLSITDVRKYYNNDGFYFNSFREIVDWDRENITFMEWTKYEVYDYWDNLIEEGLK